MADLTQLLAALGAGQQTIQKQDMYTPFSNVANQIGGLAVQTATPDNWKQAALASAISGLVGGVTGGMGANYQAEQQNLYSQSLMNQLSGIQARPEGLSNALFADSETAARNFQMMQGLENTRNQQALRQLVAGEAAKSALVSPQAGAEVLKQLMGIDPNPAREMIVSADEAREGRSQEGNLIDEVARETKNLINQGIPGVQAAGMARSAYEAKREMLTGQYKEMSELMTANEGLRSLTNNLEFAVSNAGRTGALGGVGQMGASLLGELGVESQADKAASGKLLASLGSDIVRNARQVGSGPMSDRDVALYLSAGPRLTNTPEENRLILDRYNKVVKLNDKYINYMTEAQAKGVEVSEAKKGWNDLRRQNPYFTKAKESEGGLQPNPFWFEDGVERTKALSGAADLSQGVAVAPTPTAAPVGDMRAAAMAELARRRAGR